MEPFGNFGWNFGFGFGWILVIITCVLIIAGILRLAQVTPGRHGMHRRKSDVDESEKRQPRENMSREELEPEKKQNRRA